MEKKNDYGLKALAGTLLALLFGLLIFVVADAVFPFRQLGPRAESADILPLIFMSQTFLSVAMLLLSFYLLFLYIKDYLQLKSRFTLGIILAVFSLMLFAISANPILHMFLGVFGGRGLFPLIPYFFATISLAILVYVSSK